MAVTEVVKSGLEGTLSFAIRSVNLLAAPADFTVTPSDSGGTIANTTEIWYKVSTVNADGESLPCTAVKGTAAGAGNLNKMTLGWSAVATATGYRVYSCATETGTYKLKSSISAPTVAYVDTDGTIDSGAATDLVWVEVGYCTNFSYEENDASRPIFDHYEISHYKRGRDTCTASVSALYTNRAASMYQLLHDSTVKIDPCGFKLEIYDDGGATLTETITLFLAHVTRVSFNQPDTDDDSMSIDLVYNSSDAR